MATIKLGESIPITFDSRYYEFNKDFSIRDVYDAMVELITNSDDSYHNLFKNGLRNQDGGPILIELRESRKDGLSLLIVRDKAEGMTLRTMTEKLGNVGKRQSESGARGFMARGAKDVTVLGKLTVESICDDKYYKCELPKNPPVITPLADGTRVTKELRKELGIERGNGTVVTLEIDQHKIPRMDTVVRDLPWHYAIRDIVHENSPAKILIRNLNKLDEQPEKVAYRPPEAEKKCSEPYKVPGYPDAEAKFELWKHNEPFEDPTDKRFRRSGILIKGERAIHECSFLYPGFEKDPYAMNYFGKIECKYIDTLLDEFDARLKKNLPHPPSNPSLLIDPNRQTGLRKDHPFTKALLELPVDRLRSFLAKDKEQAKPSEHQVGSEDTQRRLNELAKAASKFLTQQVEELEELTGDDQVDQDFFTKKGVLIYPTYFHIAIDQVRTFTYYLNSKLFGNKEGATINISSREPHITVLDPAIKLRKHPKLEDRLIGSFRLRGETLSKGLTVYIQAVSDGLPKAEAVGQVVENEIDEHEFLDPLEFEHKNYHVREGSKKTIRVYAKCPELVNKETLLNVTSSDPETVTIKGRCDLAPIAGSNYALAEVIVEGRRLIKENVVLTATVNDVKASTKVKVVQKEETGIPIKFELKDEPYGSFRSMWADSEGKPYLLKVSTQHDSIKRYLKLNKETGKYDGDDSLHFRVLIAEIIAEGVCRKALTARSKAKGWEYRWADQKDDSVIADSVLAEYQKLVRKFVATAHAIMVDTSRLK